MVGKLLGDNVDFSEMKPWGSNGESDDDKNPESRSVHGYHSDRHGRTSEIADKEESQDPEEEQDSPARKPVGLLELVMNLSADAWVGESEDDCEEEHDSVCNTQSGSRDHFAGWVDKTGTEGIEASLNNQETEPESCGNSASTVNTAQMVNLCRVFTNPKRPGSWDPTSHTEQCVDDIIISNEYRRQQVGADGSGESGAVGSLIKEPAERNQVGNKDNRKNPSVNDHADVSQIAEWPGELLLWQLTFQVLIMP